jgi:hypothetical protein
MGGGARNQYGDYCTMSLRSEMILDAKLVMRDGLARMNAAAEIDARGYVADWHSNLLPGIDPGLIEGDFRAGKGSELDNKFQAAHSSAALAVNVFGPFRDGRDTFPVPGLGDLNLEKFERTFTTGLVGRIPPHLDVAAIGPHGVVAIESKCLEYFTPKAASFAPAYQTLDKCRDTPWYAEMERLRESPKDYEALDAAQLVKHAFGLINSAGPGSTLLYLFWEPSDADRHQLFGQHRSEIARFAEHVAGGGADFRAMSYPELWTAWSQGSSAALRRHAERLTVRYGGSLGSYEGYSRVNGRRTDAGFFDDD